MKKIAFCLVALLLLASLFGCGRRQEILNQIESERVAESIADIEEKETNTIHLDTRPRETVAIVPDTEPPMSGETHAPTETKDPSDTAPASPADPLPPADTGTATPPTPSGSYPNDEGYRLTGGIVTGDKGYYDGVSVDVLKDRYAASGMQSANRTLINTPVGVLFNFGGKGGSAAYHKLTGNVSTLCPDPLCRHTDCAWGQMRELVYISDDHIYFTIGTDSPHLYRSDLERNHVEDLAFTMTRGVRVLHVSGHLIYLQQFIYKEDAAGNLGYGVFDCNTKEFTLLSGDKTVWVCAVVGDTIYYQIDRSETIWKADLNFRNPQVAEELAGFTGISAYSDNYLLLSKNGDFDSLYNVQTKQLTNIRGRIVQYGWGPVFHEQYVYYTKQISAEEIAYSPLKDYFQYRIPDPRDPSASFPMRGMDAGRIWRMNLETGEEEIVMELSYNGVPVTVEEFMVDGDAIYVGYLTYEDHNNYYNPDYQIGTMQVWSNEPVRYLYVDTHNGTVNLIDPYLDKE